MNSSMWSSAASEEFVGPFTDELLQTVIMPNCLKLNKAKTNLFHKKNTFHNEVLVWDIPGKITGHKNGACKVRIYGNYFGFLDTPVIVHNNFIRKISEEVFFEIATRNSN